MNTDDFAALYVPEIPAAEIAMVLVTDTVPEYVEAVRAS